MSKDIIFKLAAVAQEKVLGHELTVEERVMLRRFVMEYNKLLHAVNRIAWYENNHSDIGISWEQNLTELNKKKLSEPPRTTRTGKKSYPERVYVNQ